MKSKRDFIKISAVLVVFIMLLIPTFNIFTPDSQVDNDLNYIFILNGEEMDSITSCENYWHYEIIEGFIPCVINGTVGGITGDNMDWLLSPQENCNNVGGNFTGLNIYNQTRAEELFNELLPRCFDMDKTEISNTWLNVSKCLCSDVNQEINSSFITNCSSYDCGGGLRIDKK